MSDKDAQTNPISTPESGREPITGSIVTADEIVEQREGANTKGCLLASAIMGGAVLLCAVIMVAPIIMGIISFNDTVNRIANIFNFELNPPATARVVSSQSIVNSVRPLGQLVSLDVQVAKANIRVSVREGFQNVCGRTAEHVATASIQAGINLNSLTDGDVFHDEETDTVRVTVPYPQLTGCYIQHIDQYWRNTSTCGTAWDNLRQLAQYTAVYDFRDEAIEGGILERAATEAERTLANFLQLATGRNVLVEFAANENPVLPVSCRPDPPSAWEYNEESNTWSAQ